MWADIIDEKGFLQLTVNYQVWKVLIKDAQMWADILADKGFLQYSELPGMESPHQGHTDVGRSHSREGFPAVQ